MILGYVLRYRDGENGNIVAAMEFVNTMNLSSYFKQFIIDTNFDKEKEYPRVYIILEIPDQTWVKVVDRIDREWPAKERADAILINW